MSNVVDFRNKRDENKSLYGFEPDRSSFDEILDMWNGKYRPVTVEFNPENIPFFERQVKRYRSCRITYKKHDEELCSICLKRIIKDKNESKLKRL